MLDVLLHSQVLSEVATKWTLRHYVSRFLCTLVTLLYQEFFILFLLGPVFSPGMFQYHMQLPERFMLVLQRNPGQRLLWSWMF